ncbi:hypothetical protein [Geopseudomonas aromaticivorans]
MRSILLGGLALVTLSGCSNMAGISESLTDMTTSSLVGTWAAEYRCKGAPAEQVTILTFKQGNVPLIAQGQSYTKRTVNNRTDFVVVQIEGQMTMAGRARINEKSWIYRTSNSWSLVPWSGKRTSPNTIAMTTCGTAVELSRVSNEFITELRPVEVFKQFDQRVDQ